MSLHINKFPSVAKYILALLITILLTSIGILLLDGKAFQLTKFYSDVIHLVILAISIPMLPAIKFFLDPVGEVIKESGVVLNPEIENRIKPVLRNAALESLNVKVGIYPSEEINAFAISDLWGRKAAICFTSQLIQTVDDKQLLAFAAHEIAHLRNGDSRNKAYILTFNHVLRAYPNLFALLSRTVLKPFLATFLFSTLVLAATIMLFGNSATLFKWFVVWTYNALQPLAILICCIVLPTILDRSLNRLYHSYSKHREFVADEEGAALTSNLDMISALGLLNDSSEGDGVVDTHPPLHERINRLYRNL